MIGRGGNRRETYTVPEGRRAVVRFVQITSWDSPTFTAIFRVHGIPVWTVSNPGAFTPAFHEVRWVAYERETIVLEVFGLECSYSASGFLFEDGDGTPDDAGNTITPTSRPAPEP